MLRCSKEAFARCPTHHLCGRREDATFMEGSECDKFNQQVASQPMSGQVYVRAQIYGELPSGQKLVGILANNADGIRFYTEERCLVRIPVPVTNADRIRAMSDEELCEFLMCDVVCDQNISPDCKDCEKCVMDWLQQPAEEV